MKSIVLAFHLILQTSTFEFTDICFELTDISFWIHIKEAKPIKWIDIQTAFYLIGIGTIFGVFILGSEFIFSKCRSGKNSKCNTSISFDFTNIHLWIHRHLLWTHRHQLLNSLTSTFVGVEKTVNAIRHFVAKYLNEFEAWYEYSNIDVGEYSTFDVNEFNGWCQWIQMQMSMDSTVGVNEFKCRYRWIQQLSVSEFST
jgi:hypothetical protein